MKRVNIIVLAITLILILIPGFITAQNSGGCETCKRNGMLTEFINKHLPDYDQKLKEWQECMRNRLGDIEQFDTNNAGVKEALSNCRDLNPGYRWHCDASTMSTYIGERFTNKCFYLKSNLLHSPDTDKPPEYIFRGSYEAEIKGGSIIEYSDDYKRPVIAKMELRLFYNGKPEELVQEWTSENTINEQRALFNKLGTPETLIPLFEEFEKRPVSCEVKFSSQEEICENGLGIIRLSGFKDAGGNPSREFNRIVVSIFKGQILNGERCNIGPDYRVFTLTEGEVKIEYRPPAEKDDGYDWLRVYSSCDILPPEKFPLPETAMDKLILDEHFPVFCGFYQGTVTVSKSWNYTKQSDNTSETFTGTQTVTFNGTFKPNPQMETNEEQPIKIFVKDKVQGTWKHNEQRYCEGSGCGKCRGLVFEEWGSANISPATLDGLVIITNVWPTDNKAVADQLGQFGLENWYDIATPTEIVPTQTRTKYETENAGCQWHNSTSTLTLTRSEVRYKLKDVNILTGKSSWSSSSESSGIRTTDMTEAIYDQKPYDPEQNGNEYSYSIIWNLKAF